VRKRQRGGVELVPSFLFPVSPGFCNSWVFCSLPNAEITGSARKLSKNRFKMNLESDMGLSQRLNVTIEVFYSTLTFPNSSHGISIDSGQYLMYFFRIRWDFDGFRNQLEEWQGAKIKRRKLRHTWSIVAGADMNKLSQQQTRTTCFINSLFSIFTLNYSSCDKIYKVEQVYCISYPKSINRNEPLAASMNSKQSQRTVSAAVPGFVCVRPWLRHLVTWLDNQS